MCQIFVTIFFFLKYKEPLPNVTETTKQEIVSIAEVEKNTSNSVYVANVSPKADAATLRGELFFYFGFFILDFFS